MFSNCFSCESPVVWSLKFILLFILLFLICASIYIYYYKSLDNIKHNESKGL